MTEVIFDGVRVVRDGRLVLDVPVLTLRASRTTAVLGPNGSGKTTLLRAIAGLERLHDGRVTVGGSPVVQPTHLAYVFQENVFLRQSVRRNLQLGLQLRKVRADEQRRRIDEAANIVGIVHLLERRADRLSGGEGRRVSLARALCLRAPVVLLDEPLAGLDEAASVRLMEELPGIVDAFRATTVLVTQRRDEALRLADDLVVIVDGRVLASGEAHQVAANPRTKAVAEVLGYMVLTAGGRTIAVPRGAMQSGSGETEFSMTVDRMVDMAGSVEIIGHIGDVRVIVPWTRTDAIPAPGDCLPVHVTRACELDEESLTPPDRCRP